MVFGETGITIVIRAKDVFSNTFNKAKLSMANFRKAALGAAAVGTAIAIGFGKAIQTAIDFESAFTGVRKTVDLSEKGFEDLENRFKALSTETGTTFIELSKIGEIAGQLGVDGVDNLEKFTRTVADIAVTTNLTAEVAATAFARIANIMQLPLDQVDKMGSVVVELGNNFATTEAEIVTFANRIAGVANIVGLTTADIFAMGTAFSSVGVQAEAGGTAVQKILIKMNEATLAASMTIEEYEVLAEATGKTIEEVMGDAGGSLNAFARTAGVSADEFARVFKEDASKAFELFVLGLGKQGDEAFNTLDKLELKDVRLTRSLLSLANAGDLITRTFETSNKEWKENTALVDEAEKRYATMEREIAKVKARFAILGDEIGDRIAPFLKDILIPIIDKLIGGWKNLSPWMKDAILIFAAVTAAVGLLAGAVALLTLVASPWLLIIGAIILAITGLILLIKNWGRVTDWLREKFGPFIDFLKKMFAPQIVAIRIAIKALGMAFKLLWEAWIKPTFDKLKTFVNFLKEEVLPIILKVAGVLGKVIGGVASARQSSANNIASIMGVKKVDDFILSKGKLIETNPNDTIVGSKSGFGGMGTTIIIQGDNYGVDGAAIAEALQDKLDTLAST